MKTRIQQGFTLIELLVVITIIAILAGIALPAFTRIQERGYIAKGISNAKQVFLYLKIYAGDNSGAYPDADVSAPDTANKAFRLLFVNGIADNEAVFGCPLSEYGGKPDGDIGTPGTNTEAVATKENHWAMAKGITESLGNSPLIWECATDGSWDPSFNCDAAGKTTRGRTWSGGKVIIGMNDGSVATQFCTSASGTANKLKGTGSGSTAKNVFTSVSGTPPTVIDVE